MNKLNVYGIQLSNWAPMATLPHSICSLWNYATEFEEIRDNCILQDIFWQDESAEEVIDKITVPDILLCSCYIWNWLETYKIIQHVKKSYPACIIVIGGPEPKYSSDWVAEHPEVDVLVAYLGEVTLHTVLINIINKSYDFNNIPGVITATANNKAEAVYPVLDSIPSPYLNGMYDWLLSKQNSRIKSIRVVYETNRGCPYRCAYCDLGAKEYSKVKQFNTDRCINELKWIVKNKIHVIDVADSNFGIFPRDEIFVDTLIELKNTVGYSGSFMPTWSKTKGKHVISLGKKIIKSGLDTMFNISIQSTNQDSLTIVSRTNTFSFEELSNVIIDLRNDGISVYTDIILPLPGDTKSSIQKGMEDLIDLPLPFNKLQINHLSRLTNTPLNNDTDNKFNIKWAPILGGAKHYYGETTVDTIASSTKHMDTSDVFESVFYTKMIYQPLYYYGLCRNLCDSMYESSIMKRSEVINKIVKYMYSTEWFKNFKEATKSHYYDAISGNCQLGFKLDDTPWYYPDYAKAYTEYMDNNIHTALMEVFDSRHHEVLQYDLLSQWNNTPRNDIVEMTNWNPGIWQFKETRKYSQDAYLGKVFIRGRFGDEWKTQEIKKCQ